MRTEGAAALATQPVGRLLWHNCAQNTASVGIYGVYALTNAWFVEHGVGTTAMAAVNLVTPILLIMGAVSTTVGVGGASLVSRALGAGDPASAARAAGTAFVLFWATAITVTVAGLAALGPLLTLLGAAGDARPVAGEYATIIVAGAIVSTGFSSLVRAEGRMRFATLLWLVPVLVQITLDPVLIFWAHWGVRGAAVGTVGGQAVSAGMSVWFFFLQRDRPYRVGRADLRPNLATVRALLDVGAPSFLSGFGATLLAVLVNTTLARTGGAGVLAAYAVCARIQTFVQMPHLGISQGLQPVVGYNTGAGRPDRVARVRTLALRATLAYGVATSVALFLLTGPVIAVFVTSPGVAATARQAVRIMAAGFAVAGVTPLVSAYYQSLGRPRSSYVLSIGTLLAVKAPLVFILGRLGTVGIWISLPAGELVAAAIALAVLRRNPLVPR